MKPLTPAEIPRGQQAIALLWPSFISAIIATGVFFSAFDPKDLVPYDFDIDVSPLAAYSTGFFIFWIISLMSSYGTLYFTISNCRFLNKQNK